MALCRALSFYYRSKCNTVLADNFSGIAKKEKFYFRNFGSLLAYMFRIFERLIVAILYQRFRLLKDEEDFVFRIYASVYRSGAKW